MPYQITPLAMGLFHNYEKSWLLYNACCGERITAAVTAFLIQGEAVNILVDTGCCDAETAARHYHAPLDRPQGMELLKALDGIGLEPEQINCIIHTHLHWDHCYNNALFPHCKIYVQKKEVQYAIAPLPCQCDEYESGQAGHQYPWLKSFPQFELIDGDMDILPGIRLISLPGHTRGFQGVLVDTVRGKELIAGDSLPLYENWLGVKGKRFIPAAVHVDTRDCLNSYRKMAECSDYIWAGNDLRALEGYCIRVGREGGAEDELAHV